jgi:hypothetical protein
MGTRPNGAFAGGHPKVNGIVLGFMGEIGRAVCALPECQRRRD